MLRLKGKKMRLKFLERQTLMSVVSGLQETRKSLIGTRRIGSVDIKNEKDDLRQEASARGKQKQRKLMTLLSRIQGLEEERRRRSNGEKMRRQDTRWVFCAEISIGKMHPHMHLSSSIFHLSPEFFF